VLAHEVRRIADSFVDCAHTEIAGWKFGTAAMAHWASGIVDRDRRMLWSTSLTVVSRARRPLACSTEKNWTEIAHPPARRHSMP